MKRVLTLLLLLMLGFTGRASADCTNTPAPVSFEVRITNNSADTWIYPVFDIGPKDNAGVLKVADLWMQAQCGIANPTTWPTHGGDNEPEHL
jgi:hypothetical protein